MTWLLSALKIDKLAIYFIVGLLALVAIIVFPNIDYIKETFGIDTVRSLRVEIAKEIKNTEDVVKINENLNEVIEVHEESAKINIKVVAKRAAKVAKVNKKLEVIQNKVEAIVVDDEISYEVKSEAVIDGLWESYCLTSDQCK
jgi:hypothetical protein